jgi:hypothetical protein
MERSLLRSFVHRNVSTVIYFILSHILHFYFYAIHAVPQDDPVLRPWRPRVGPSINHLRSRR